MVAILKAGSSIRNTLHYNENKVDKGQAVLLHAAHFGKDKERLQFGDKLKHFQKVISLNEKTKVNSIHISLNFDPSEQLSEQKLGALAEEYINKIGFANQPYLLYQHHDAGHPHIHLVTTNIRRDGSRISLHNIGRNQSETARKEIEIKYGLVQASGRQTTGNGLTPVDVRKIHYGKSESKRAITNVLDAVLPHYKYTSLAELNAILGQYNVIADGGTETSRIYNRKGLVYHILDRKGQKIGVPIKASLIYNKPTLKNIEARFAQNERDRQRYKQRVKNAVDLSLLKGKHSIFTLQIYLKSNKIDMVLRHNQTGLIYGVTYIDHQTKCVFNGSKLGKQYSANAIQQRCLEPASLQHQNVPRQQQANDELKGNSIPSLPNLLHHLTESDNQFLASELGEDRTRKKKKQKRQ